MESKMTKLFLIPLVLAMLTSCAAYSTANRPESENIINAPIDVVWDRTLEILPTERITLKQVDKENYFIAAKKHITFWSFGDDISIRLIPKGKRQTVMEFSSGTLWGGLDFGHEGRMVRNIFERIRKASESTALSNN